MIQADYHMHTSFSLDSEAEPESMIQGAIQKGLKRICITDHEDHGYIYEGNEFTFSVPDYFDTLEKLKEKYRDQIDIRIGVEIGLQPDLGSYYHEYVNDVPVVVMDLDNSSLSRQLVQYFDDNERFTVAYHVDTEDEMKELIDDKKAYMGIYIPPNMYDKIKEGEQTQVLILVDQTNVIIGNNVYAGAASIIQTVSAGAAIKVVEGKDDVLEDAAYNTVMPMQFNERMLYDTKMTYMNYLMYGLFAILIQSLMLSAMATLMTRNPYEVASDHTFARLAAKIVVAATLILTMGSVSVFLLHKKFGLIINSNVKVALLMAILFAVAISVPAIILISIVKKKTRYTQIVYCLSLPTFFTCGYVWPIAQMPKVLVGIVRTIWPLMNFARPFDEVMIKNLPFSAVWNNVMGLIFYIVIGMPIAIWCFKKGFSESLSQDEFENTARMPLPSDGGVSM